MWTEAILKTVLLENDDVTCKHVISDPSLSQIQLRNES